MVEGPKARSLIKLPIKKMKNARTNRVAGVNLSLPLQYLISLLTAKITSGMPISRESNNTTKPTNGLSPIRNIRLAQTKISNVVSNKIARRRRMAAFFIIWGEIYGKFLKHGAYALFSDFEDAFICLCVKIL